MALILPAALVAALWEHAQRETPRECVGAIGGTRQGGGDGDEGTLRASALYPLPNVAPDPERTYLADPGHLLRALRAMQAEGIGLIALYHSHPHGPQHPSSTDVRLAAYPVPYLIADLHSRSLRAFHLPGGTPLTVQTDWVSVSPA